MAAGGKAALARPRSKTWRHFGRAARTRSVMECGTRFRFGRQTGTFDQLEEYCLTPLRRNCQTNRLILDRFGRRFGVRTGLRMNIWPVIRAPIVVQLNRIAFAFYAAVFGSVLWRYRHTACLEGTEIFLCMFFSSVLAITSSCIRARRSRWIMAVLGLLIPGLVFASMCFLEFSRPEGLLDWFQCVLIALVLWFGVPIMLALSLFWEISFSSIKRNLDVEINPSRKSAEYFTGADKARAA
jgi:hypothetical protein